MTWLIVAIFAYFFLAIVSLFDRYFLVGPIPNPKAYTFSVGIVGIFICLFLLPFGIILPEISIIILGLSTGFVRNFAVFFLTKSIVHSEVSRVVPAIGGFLPIFSFLLFFIYFPREQILNLPQITAFILLLIGSVLITIKKISFEFFNFQMLKYPIITAFLFALTYFLTKKLFLATDFLTGVFLFLLGGGIGAIIFLVFPDVRKIVFVKKSTQKTLGIFLLGQLFGGLGVGFLYYAVFLAKPNQVPLINALEGIRYAFLLFFVILLAKKFPQILKEQVSKEVVFQKVVAILVIAGGLLILALNL